MKRFISAALVLLALGGAAFFFFKMRRYLPERPRGAELAPAETLLFVQFPNLRQTALRIPKTDLYQIWKEPDVQAFLEKPRLKASWMGAWERRFEEMARVAPGELFLAVTSFDLPRPDFVGGFSFAGRQRQAEALAGQLREQLLPGGEFASVVRSNWYLFATDADSLARLRERFDRKPGAALAEDPIFQRSIARLGVAPDLVLYGKPEALTGSLDILSGFGGKGAPPLPVAMATKIDGAKLRDTIFLPGGAGPTGSTLSHQMLAIASPQTLLYYATDLALLPSVSESSMLAALLPGFARMERSLGEKGLTWKDLPGATGPELAAMCEWPEDAALPTLLLASEIRDPVKAQAFAEVLTGPASLGAAWQPEAHAGFTLQNAPPLTISFVRPSLALTDRFALLGMSPDPVKEALPRIRSGAAVLGKTSAFQDVLPFLPSDAVAFGYLDFPRIFERVYQMTRPFITLSLAFSPETGAQWDAGKLPPVDAIAKHLSASVIAQTRSPDGVVIESTGSLTIPEVLFAVSAGGFASGLTDVSRALPGGLKGPSTPSQQPAPKAGGNPAVGRSEAAPPLLSPEKTASEHK